jgi:putative tricarboxylic transport membrane protein
MENMMDDTLFVVLGTLLGFVSGLVPGVGNTIMIIASYPLLKDASMLQMLLYYLAIISSSQFSGSVVATVFGIPGESSSLPAVIEGNRMFRRGVGNFAISNAAIGSVLGAFVAVLAVYSILPFAIELIKEFYNNTVQLVILLVATTSICFVMGKSIAQNIFVFGIGIVLALVGTQGSPYYVFLPEVIPYETFPLLLTNLPFFPLIISLYVFPVLLQTYKMFDGYESEKKYEDNNKFSEHCKEFYKNISSSLRGSAFGCFIGLVPHIGAAVSSNLSYAIEKKFGIRWGQYHTKGDIKTLVAAETANNSTGLVSLLPLILIGIPITVSEAMLLGYIEINSYTINYQTTVDSGMFETMVIWFVLINAVSFILAWPLVRYINLLQKISIKQMVWATGLALVALCYYLGAQSYEEVYYMSVMICLLPLGYWLRKAEPMILVIAFILQDKLFASMHIFYQIHFG